MGGQSSVAKPTHVQHRFSDPGDSDSLNGELDFTISLTCVKVFLFLVSTPYVVRAF